MNARGWRLTTLTSIAAATGGALLLLGMYVVARSVILQGGGPDAAEVVAELRRQFLGWALLVLPTLYYLGHRGGSFLARSLDRLRRTLLQRAYAGLHEEAEPVSPRIRELRAAASAAETLFHELSRRSAGVDAQRSALAVLVDSVSDGLLRIDAAGRIVFANPACRSLLELLPSALGQPYTVMVRNSELRDLIQRALEGGRVSSEVAFGERRVLVSAQPIGQERAPEGAVVALADLTALRRLEGVRRDFVANVSHELKTPLTSIRGYSETLIQDDVPADIRRQFLDVIHKNAGRLQMIVDELLDLSRIESGGWQPDFQPLNTAEVVRDVWASCRDAAEKRRVRFQAPVDAPAVLADPGALRHILGNLFDNALRYTPDEGTIEVHVSRTHRPQHNGQTPRTAHAAWVMFEVRDNGTGIPREALPRIFERFYRVDPARSRAEGGTGLGLSIVKHLVETMGGEVSALSELGKGTTLRFTLPAAT